MKTLNKYITHFICAICKKRKHKNDMKIVKPLTIHCNSCVIKNQMYNMVEII